ncbi:hypothetical protein SERLA73DRAFT_184181 [Serpula lacrymans var. lacrymans S7.3]|uniref:Transcription factor TFIIIC triple barrel domain-containing protein n=2 Tax=Serpula lacrymans var. lacrymans TaxID=341189 RepID=F8Q2Q2_SERL3|nr:uncharacterized protein SERLADRAFT_471732 [Serpula lacrymans var. lacrymans S7.9]EGN97463.1 hypothetical protein SERLA73DRAFT_184181 [Serpula lacrymans var. lacrymans S7.3]EGO23055.1 hypothetical protein SERLADRAFT_471732 [Serpula lacrymans var. lacrymans S7.9]
MTPPSSLFPGYRQVEAFGPDDEYSDEEISYVTLDLGNVEPTLVPSSSTYRLIGLDTPMPFLQLSGTIFKGQHDSLLGTELLFTEAKDDHDRSKRFITHVANTEQRVRFKEVELKAKQQDPPQPIPDQSSKESSNKNEVFALERMTGKSFPPNPPKRTRSKRSDKKGKQREVIPDQEQLTEKSVGIVSDMLGDEGEE